MNIQFVPEIRALCAKIPFPVYAVGGYVRNFLIDGEVSEDLDLAAPVDLCAMKPYVEECGAKIIAEYKRTGTAVFVTGGVRCEFTSFRKESYAAGGGHSPESVERTDDIKEDALRRDFKCNAVYYDIKKNELIDPLGGVSDIRNKILDTVKSPEKVFCSDGLRLLRLARFCGELGFKPTESLLNAAKKYADNIKDVSCERIYSELNKILVADGKYKFSPKDGHYRALKILDETRVLDRILPELTLGRGMEQRKDYHNHDVLEHSLRCVLYAPQDIRLAALLHDVAKPYCMKNFGSYRGHDAQGKNMVGDILGRLKAGNRATDEVKFLVGAHMYDLDGKTSVAKVRRFIADNEKYYEKLTELKIADGKACKDEDCIPPQVLRWQEIYAKMKKDGTPIKVSDLKISAKDLQETGFSDEKLGAALKTLRYLAIDNPQLNNKESLSRAAKKLLKG